MSIRADRDPRAFRRDDPQPLHIEILPVGISIYLERGAGLDRVASDPLPITAKAGAKVVNAPARVGEDLYVRIFEGAEIPVRLIVA